jgi:tetratricopeptide (TPR) repeat protein
MKRQMKSQMKRTAIVLLTSCTVLFAQQTPARRSATPQPALTNYTLAQAEALWRAHDYKSAGHVFELLLKQEPTNSQYRVRYADLLADQFNAADAENLYQEALQLDPKNAKAYIGLAEIYADGFNELGAKSALEALKLDPKLYHGHEILARIALEDNNLKQAAESADAALGINPDAVEAIAIHGTIDLLNDKPSTWIAKIGNRGEGYADIAAALVTNRRYEDGMAYYRKAIAATPDLWRAHSQLGVNLMRFGQNNEARKELELAYNNGYTDAATANTLKLMDSYKDFTTYYWPNDTAPVGILRLNVKEADALRPYFEAEMKRAMATYEKKYNYKMKVPVQVEVYVNHGDFEVRVMGLPGIGGILGVTFDNIVAMDGPSAREKSEGYHWASVMWHELSHVYVLNLTHERVPRWFTEGVSVHEETATTADWGDRLSPNIVVALKDKKLLPISEIDRGFVHPTFPEQVIVSYFEAGKIADYIAKRWGDSKLVDMMNAFAGNRETVDVIREQLKMEPEAFDKDFQADLYTQYGKTIDGFEQWTRQMRDLNTAIKDGKPPSDLLQQARDLEALYPDYVEAGNPYVMAANACVKSGNKACAIAEFAKYSKIGGRELDAMEQYASLLAEAGQKKDAAAALNRMVYVFPLDAGLHQKLGNLDIETGNTAEAVREFQVLVALNPGDKAGSHYNLAMAYKADGQTDKAREEAITALEAAPEYRPAQKLLLEVSGDAGNK